MAKLKEIAKKKEALPVELALGAGLLDETKKFLGVEGTQALVDQIKTKADKATTLEGYGITDAYIEDGVITLGENSVEPIEVPESGETGSVLTLVGDKEVEWQKVDFSSYATLENLKSYVNGAKYVDASEEEGENEGKPVIQLLNGTNVLCEIPAQPFLKDSFLKDVDITDGTGDNLNKKVLKFTFETASKGDGVAELTPIEIPLDDIFTPGNYYDKDELDEILYGEGGTAEEPTGGLAGDINGLDERLQAIEDLDIDEISAEDIAAMFAGTYQKS